MEKTQRTKEFSTFKDLLEYLGSSSLKIKNGGIAHNIVFDLTNKRISSGKTVLYDKGIIPQEIRFKRSNIVINLEENLPLGFEQPDNPYEELEKLYHIFKHSVNSGTYEPRCNFLAKHIDNMGYMEFLQGGPRNLARVKLESYVMFTSFKWKNENHFFWRSENDPELILKREWIN